MAITSFDFEFEGFVGKGSCNLTIDTVGKGGHPCVVCSQKRDYAGTSITNALERIARKLYLDVAQHRLGLRSPKLADVESQLRSYWKTRGKPVSLRSLYGQSAVRWIEHYPAGTGLISGETFREVQFDSEDSPLWQASLNAASAKGKFGQELIEEVQRFTNGERQV